MSKRHVLPVKLSPPRLGRVLDRQRLFEVLDGLSGFPGIWVAAAPGAGKSSLVATWLQRRARHTLWLQVDAGDADPATFLQSLDMLLSSTIAPSIDLPPFHADDLSDLAGWLRRRLRLLMPLLPSSWALVLDNHQELPGDSPLQAALARAMGELPPGVQWIFVSRENPPNAWTAALARQQLAVLDSGELRFDADETIALTRLHGRPLAIGAALDAAQGWVGGMTLILLGSRPNTGLPGFEARQRLIDYFAGEVLEGMSASDDDALCRIAFLPSATGPMAAALSGHAGASALLERLAALSLFTDRREGRPPAYVFHGLFSEFLRKRFEERHPADAVKALRQRAARLLAAAGQSDASLQLMIEAECWSDARDMMLASAARYVDEGRTLALRQHIDKLPSNFLAPHPIEPHTSEPLIFWRGFCVLDTDPGAALPDLKQALSAGIAARDADWQLAAASGAATALVSTGRVGELDACIDVLTRHATRAAVMQPEVVEMRWVPGLLAAVVYRAPWHPLAEALAERAERLLHREAAPGQRLLLGSLAFHLLWRGQVDRLERIVLRIDALCAGQLAAPATMMRWWGVGILVKVLLGQLPSARNDVGHALALVDAEPSVASHRANAELLSMIVSLAERDPVAARQSLDAAARALHPDDAVGRTTYEHQRGILALLEDDSPTALRLMRAAVVSARASGFPMREHIALIANALAAARSGEHAEAASLLEDVFSHPFHTVCRWHHWIAGSVASYAALCRADTPSALLYLRQALGVARECGFRAGPMLYCCGDMMAQLAALALENDIETELARELVMRNNLAAPLHAGARWPWPVRLHSFGGLQVERNGSTPPASRKESRRLLELLRLLIAHGASAAPVDALADGLWPDADGDAARNALDNALHRLRKWLGGDDRILLRQGALSLNPQRCWTDVRALESILVRLDESPIDGVPALVMSLRRLYRAPLLPEDAQPAVVRRRAALHRQVEGTLRRAGERLASAGQEQQVASIVQSLPDR